MRGPRPDGGAAAPSSPGEFLAQLHLGVQRSGGAEWLAGRADGDAVIALFRRDWIQGTSVGTGPVEGVRLVFEDFAAAILGPGTHRIADVLTEAVLEVVEPHPLGIPLDVPWADGLRHEPERVLWVGDVVPDTRGTDR